GWPASHRGSKKRVSKIHDRDSGAARRDDPAECRAHTRAAVAVSRALIAAAIVATIACGRSREIVSTEPAASPTPTSSSTSNRADRSNEARVNGQVSDLAGACPSVTFTVANNKVSTSATTNFGRDGCRAIANGASADVEGIRQTDGSIQAIRVEVNRHAR